MADAMHAHGTKLNLTGDIAEVTNISGPGFSVDMEDVTSHDSDGAWEEVLPTIKRSGEISVDINYDPGNNCYADKLGNFEENATLTFPDANVWTFDCYVSGFEPEAPVEGKLAATITLKLTGEPTV